jgi:PHP family Zn ribbon phosphoesterase
VTVLDQLGIPVHNIINVYAHQRIVTAKVREFFDQLKTTYQLDIPPLETDDLDPVIKIH